MWADNRQRLGVEVRHVDGVADRTFEQCGANGLRNLNSDTFLRFGSGSAKMRRENKVRRGTKRRTIRQWLNFKDIEGCGGHVSILQCVCEPGFLDETSSSAIDNAHAAFCSLQTHCVENVSRFRRERGV